MKKYRKTGEKTVIFESEMSQNGGSVGNLYFNSNGGMRVGEGGFRKGFYWLYIGERRNIV